MIKNIYRPNTPVMRALDGVVGSYPVGLTQEVPAPVVSVIMIDGAPCVDMSCEYKDASIFYATDVDMPAEEWLKYEEPIPMDDDVEYFVVATLKEYKDSKIVDAKLSMPED